MNMKAFYYLVILGSLIQSLYTMRISVVAILNAQWFSKHKEGFFCEHFLLETRRYWDHLDPVTFAWLCSRFRVQPIPWNGMVGLPRFAWRDVVWRLIAGLFQHLWGMFAIPNHGLASCYNLPFCMCCEDLAVFFSQSQCLCIRPLTMDVNVWN